MVQAMEGTIGSRGAGQTQELTSALGHLLERIGASSSHEDAEPSMFEMSADEVDSMLGLHRAVPASPLVGAEEPVDDHDTQREAHTNEEVVVQASVTGVDSEAPSADGLPELRRARIFETSVDRRALLVAMTVPGLLALAIAGVAAWFVSSQGDPAIESPAQVQEPAQVQASAQVQTPAQSPQPSVTTVATTVPGGGIEAGAAAIISDQSIALEARAALDPIGIIGAELVVTDGRVTVDAVAPLDALADGYFALKEQITEAVSVEGASGIEVRLELRGDAVTLRDMLDGITLGSPVTFESGVAEVDPTHRTTLDLVAAAITSQPGLPVIVAGTTDSSGSSASNEALARSRAESVVRELVERGVPTNRLQIVSYGELFPDAETAERSVRFEVGA